MGKKKKNELTLMIYPLPEVSYAQWPYKWLEKHEVQEWKERGWKRNEEVRLP